MELQSFWLLMAHLDLYSLVFDNDCDQKIAVQSSAANTDLCSSAYTA